MEDKPIEVIGLPSFDLTYYVNEISHFVASHFPQLVIFLKDAFGYVIGLSLVISVVFFIGIIFVVEGLKSIRRKEGLIYDAKIEIGYETVEKAGNPELTNKWKSIVVKIESDNESDWRQAIIESDVILADLLTGQGYKGDSIGEQLKRVVKGDFENIDQAWEAHKIRNMIAHSGADFVLNQIEARRIINLYKQVFEEFYYI